MAFGKGKTLNPELIKAADEHSADHAGCMLGRPTFSTSQAHQSWRKSFKDHTGNWPPATWLPKEKPAAAAPSAPAAVTESAQLQPFLFNVEETPVSKSRRTPRRKSLTGH